MQVRQIPTIQVRGGKVRVLPSSATSLGGYGSAEPARIGSALERGIQNSFVLEEEALIADGNERLLIETTPVLTV